MKRGEKSKSPEEKRATAGARRAEVRAGEPAESGEIETADPLFVEAEETADPEVVEFPVPGEEFALREVSEEEIERLPPPPPEVVPSDPAPPVSRRNQPPSVAHRKKRLDLSRRYRDEGDIGRGLPDGGVEPAPRREDRLRVPPQPLEPSRPHPGGQHRTHAGRGEVRPLARGAALLLRGVVDPRLHDPLHPEQLVAWSRSAPRRTSGGSSST